MTEQQVNNLQHHIQLRLQLLETLIKGLKVESTRALVTQARYKSQHLNDGVFSNAGIKDNNYRELNQYSSLISKQFCGRLDELRTSYLALKLQTEKIAKKNKSKPQPSDTQKLSALNATLKEYESKFAAIWKEEHFLVLNYKLDCAAKELERWTAVIQGPKKTPEMITTMVNSMFS